MAKKKLQKMYNLMVKKYWVKLSYYLFMNEVHRNGRCDKNIIYDLYIDVYADHCEVEDFYTQIFPSDLVLDCFAGSGTTGEAAARLLRRFLLCDVSEEAVAIMRDRLEFASPRVLDLALVSDDGPCQGVLFPDQAHTTGS